MEPNIWFYSVNGPLFQNIFIFEGHDQLVFQLVKIQLVTNSVSDDSVSDGFQLVTIQLVIYQLVIFQLAIYQLAIYRRITNWLITKSHVTNWYITNSTPIFINYNFCKVYIQTGIHKLNHLITHHLVIGTVTKIQGSLDRQIGPYF